MNRTRAPLLVAALAFCGAGCLADNTDSLIIVQNQVLNPAMSCSVPATATATSLSSGILDVALVEAGYDGYYVYPLVLNNLIDRANAAAGVASRDSIIIEGSQVELQGTLASRLPGSQQSFSLSSFGGTIDPSATAGVISNLIPRQVALELAAMVTGAEPSPPTVVAHFRITGIRAGGELDSAWVDFPIELCRYCLTGGPPAPCLPPGMGAPLKADVALGGCNISQDVPVFCCSSGEKLLCGSAVPVTTAAM